MYKDKDKQREAVRAAVAKHRRKAKGITVIPIKCNTHDVIPLAPGQYEVGSTVESIMPDDYEEPTRQSRNPMMVGYTPPKEQL